MTVRHEPLVDRLRAAAWRSPWWWGWVLLSLVLVPLLSFRHQSELVGCYLPAAQRALAGQSLDGDGGWVYPPFFLLPVLPLAWLPVALARMAWCAMLVGCAVHATRSIWNTLMLDESFRMAVKVPARFFAFTIGLGLAAAGHAITPLGYQSHDLVVMALICSGAWHGARAFRWLGDRLDPARERAAGVRFGLAASCKVMPALFLPVLVAERRLRAACWMAFTGLVAAALFDTLTLVCFGRAHFVAWLRLAAGGSDLTSSGGGRWASWNHLNQSGTGILGRLMVPTPPDMRLGHECMVVAVGDSARRVVLGLWVLLVTAIVLTVAWRTSLAPRSRLRRQGTRAAMHALAATGATACAYLLVAPQASNYHFAPVAIAAAAMLGWLVAHGRDRLMVACLVVMMLVEVSPGRDLLGDRLANIKLAYGSVGLCAVVGLIGALRVMVRSARPEPAACA